MQVDTDVFEVLVERASVVGLGEALALRVEHVIEWNAMIRRAAMPAAVLVYGTRTGRPRHARQRHLRVVR